MAKGLFTQGMCVLLREPLRIEDIQECLQSLAFQGLQEPISEDDALETLVYEYPPGLK